MDSTLAKQKELVASETTDYNENVQINRTEWENGACLNLLDLHEEILHHIFHYIEAKHLLDSVANVCTCLRKLLSIDTYWKLRLFERFPKPYPVVNVSTFSWPEACKARETSEKRWKDGLDKKKIVLNKTHGSAIDCVHITQKNSWCICGGRDRSIVVWRVDEDAISTAEALDTPTIKETCSLFQHKGWVWSISSKDDEFCTTSFDSTVKFWDTGSLATGKEKSSVCIKSAILCSAYIDRNSVVAGCFNKKSVILDTRCDKVCQEFIHHERAVLCVSSNDNIVASTGEDRLIILTDIRTLKIVQKIKKRSFYLSMDHCDEQIWVGANNGTIGVYDSQSSGAMKLTAKFNYEFNGKITGLRYTPGAVYAGCTDGWLKIYEPSSEPKMLAGQQLEAKGVTDLSVCNDLLAVSTADGLVALWHP